MTITGAENVDPVPFDLAAVDDRALLVAIYRRLLTMPTQADLQAAVDSVKAVVDTIPAAIGAASQRLGDQIANLEQAVTDGTVPQSVLDELNGVKDSLTSAAASLTDAGFGEPVPPTPPEVTPA